VLLPDNSVYCTVKRYNTNIILKFEEDYPFTITHLIVKAPKSGFNSPVGEGLVFVSYELPDVSLTSNFDDFDSVKYDEFMASRCSTNSPRTLSPADPVAYFKLKDTFGAVQRLTIPRSGYYVAVKLIRSRNGGENIDIQYIGFKGFVGPHAFQDGGLI